MKGILLKTRGQGILLPPLRADLAIADRQALPKRFQQKKSCNLETNRYWTWDVLMNVHRKVQIVLTLMVMFHIRLLLGEKSNFSLESDWQVETGERHIRSGGEFEKENDKWGKFQSNIRNNKPRYENSSSYTPGAFIGKIPHLKLLQPKWLFKKKGIFRSRSWYFRFFWGGEGERINFSRY